jgi:3-phosphoshikimate 1-carboxyvinyltransferase
MQRACAAALLSKGRTVLKNPGHSNDDKAAIEIIKALGANCSFENGELIIESAGLPFANENTSLIVDCGESGLSSRMFGSIIALSDKRITMTGSGSLTSRPMDFFDMILPQLDVKVKSNNGKLPMDTQGPLVPATIEVDGSLSSQFLTGLLIAYSASGAKEVSIKVKDLKSKPYVDLTLDVMRKFGMRIPENNNYKEFSFLKTPINQ